jgi:hypothetical protein
MDIVVKYRGKSVNKFKTPFGMNTLSELTYIREFGIYELTYSLGDKYEIKPEDIIIEQINGK